MRQSRTVNHLAEFGRTGSYFRSLNSCEFSYLIVVALIFFVMGCDTGESHSHESEAAAKIIELNDELKIATLKLSPKAEKRLAIATVETIEVDRARRRAFGGEVIVQPGQLVSVVAPIAGTVKLPNGGKPIVAGSIVSQDQVVFDFQPLSTEQHVLSPSERISMANAKALLATAQIEASREIDSARIRKEAAQIVYERAKKLFDDEAGSQRTVDEAAAQLKLAQEAEKTARERNEFLSGISLDVETDELTRSEIKAPVGGIVQSLMVAPNESVAAGEPLFDVANLDQLWIRVPVYVGYRHEIDFDKDATITELGKRQKHPPRSAKTVAAPHIADPAASSVDFFYVIDNKDGRLYPGQRIMASLTMQSKEKSLLVPWSSVLYDIHGAAWVYEQTEPRTYERRRVELKHVDEDKAVLSAGPHPGSKIVTDGAAELFGREFYYVIKPGGGGH